MQSAKEVFREEAMPFIQLTADSKEFTINEDCCKFLRSLEGPFGVISVAGMYRTGKSYLLNRMLLNRQKGFGVGPTVNPCTKGLWIWGTPVPGFTPEGEAINVLVIDTEGLGALDEDPNHDARVFSLALLLSTYFVYNSVGSIDEAALQNLNLVVSLTRHIHIKAQGKDESEIEPEEYSKYFPSFVWVVRDFTLQLVDEEGESLSPHDYLEKALQPQNGTSEAVEQKNRIRRLLKSFFPDRDCCTMVRPLTKEDGLQNLENLDFKELRPEFVEQIMNLRRKVINRMRLKTLNGKALNGEMFCNLAQSYVAAINKGAVPNIESAWTYICKNECMKAFQKSIEKYDATIRELTNEQLPMDETELKEAHKEAYQTAVAEFNKISVGAAAGDYVKDLSLKIKQRYATLKVENEREAKKCIQEFLSSAYTTIEQKLKNNEFPSFADYEKELKAFQFYFLENGPPGPNRKVILLEYCQRVLDEVADMFYKKALGELDLQKTLTQDTVQKLEAQVAELKEEHKKEFDQQTLKLRALESERAELSAKEQGLRESCNTILKEKAAAEKELREQLDEEKKESQRTAKGLKDKIGQQEEMMRTMQEKVLTTESNCTKQLALLEQKITYLDKSLEESRTKEKGYSDELKNVKKDYSASTKEISAKYEGQVKDLQQKLDAMKEQMAELDTKMNEELQKHETAKSQWQEELAAEVAKKDELAKVLSDLRAQIEGSAEKVKTEQKSAEEKFDSERGEYQKTVADLQAHLKSMDEQTKAQKVKWEKEEAVHKQKQEFYEVQLAETKKQLEESRKSHETMIKALESKDKDVACQEEASKQIVALKEEHLKEIREIENNHEEMRKRLTTQLEQLSEKTNELELKLKLQQTDREKELEANRDQVAALEAQNQKMVLQMKQLDQQKVKLLEETEKNYKEVIQGLETQADEKAKKAQTDLQEMQKRSEDSLAQLRNFYELEKEKLEQRIVDEKEKARTIYAQQIEECEQKLKDEQQQRAEEVEVLQNDLAECEAQNRGIISHLEQEAGLQKQKIQTLEEQLKDSKDQFTKTQSLNNTSLEQQMSNFAEERKGLIEKIERLSHEITTKERMLTTLENRNDSMKLDLEKAAKSADENKAERLAEKNSLNERVETLKAKNQQLADDCMQKKLDFSRESALLKQQGEFQNNKIRELQTSIEELTKRYEEKLTQLKQEQSQQLKDTIETLGKDKEQCEQKYELKRKALKELEANISRQTAKLEKEKSQLADKCAALEVRTAEMEKQHQDETAAFQAQIIQLKDVLSKDHVSVTQDNDKMKKELLELDKQLCEVQANYDKDKELWADKFQFLEQQRDQAKSDLAEAQRKFELTLEQLQKRGSIDKDKSETNQMALISSLEQKHKYQIKELNDSHQHVCNELVQKNKQLEKELKSSNEKLQFEQRGKQMETGTLEKKVAEFGDAYAKASKELEDVKADRDRRVLEYQKLFEKEREAYKVKLQDSESKCAEVDSKRGVLMMEFEKERAKWSLERDHLISQKNEAQEIIGRLEKRKETLLLENDKLKSERVTRKPLYAGVANSTTSIGSRYTMASRKYKENLGETKYGQQEDKMLQPPHDATDTDSSHSSKSRSGMKSTRSCVQKPEEESKKE